jgi:AraC-like DNA-binding protein
MSKTRHGALPDGSWWIRTHPHTVLDDWENAEHRHEWHQLTFAVRGQLEIATASARWLLPSDRALWVPANLPHRELMRAHVQLRMLYLAPGAVPRADDRVRALVVTPLLRELILHITRIGALDARVPAQRHLAEVLVDLLAHTEEAQLDLPMPRDPRARKLIELLEGKGGARVDVARLARRCGASLRTLERCFRTETGLALGEWRRRWRLFAAMGRIDGGTSVTAAALDAGYSGPSAFTAAFRRQFGAAPSQHRRR